MGVLVYSFKTVAPSENVVMYNTAVSPQSKPLVFLNHIPVIVQIPAKDLEKALISILTS